MSVKDDGGSDRCDRVDAWTSRSKERQAQKLWFSSPPPDLFIISGLCGEGTFQCGKGVSLS